MSTSLFIIVLQLGVRSLNVSISWSAPCLVALSDSREVPEYDFSCQNPWRLYGFFIRRFRAVKSSGFAVIA